MQAEQAALNRYAYLGPGAVQRLAGLGPLYDTSMVFENFPDAAADPAPGDERLPVAQFSGRDAYHYPLKLLAAPGERLRLEISHRPELVPDPLAAEAMDRLTAVLEGFAADPHRQPDPGPAVVDRVGELAGEVLGAGRLGAGADFFAAGGDSLLALRLAGRIREVLGADVDPALIFRRRTPTGIAVGLAAPPVPR
nr:hypothetical protein GCM10020092_037750 [Actinoplanes digitatis]